MIFPAGDHEVPCQLCHTPDVAANYIFVHIPSKVISEWLQITITVRNQSFEWRTGHRAIWIPFRGKPLQWDLTRRCWDRGSRPRWRCGAAVAFSPRGGGGQFQFTAATSAAISRMWWRVTAERRSEPWASVPPLLPSCRFYCPLNKDWSLSSFSFRRLHSPFSATRCPLCLDELWRTLLPFTE